MPWFWSDDLAQVLLDLGKIDSVSAATMSRSPIAVRTDSAAEVSEGDTEESEEPLLAA